MLQHRGAAGQQAPLPPQPQSNLAASRHFRGGRGGNGEQRRRPGDDDNRHCATTNHNGDDGRQWEDKDNWTKVTRGRW